MAGTELANDGYLLGDIQAPTALGEQGELSFVITGPDGAPVVDFEVSHDRALHLMVVRTDGQNFRHVHPELDTATGRWSLPWSWDEAGSYRVIVDIVPTGASSMTLSHGLDIAGDLQPRPATAEVRSTEVGGYTVSVSGDLVGGGMTDLVLSVSKDGAPVTTLEPYLGAFGHLVNLRQGDLSYLHIHPQGEEPQPGQTSGPDVTFMAHTPSEGRYLLYFDFQVAGQVHSAHLVLEAEHGEGGADHGSMDHSAMGHGGMDHAAMGHGEMDHSKMDHGSMDHSAMGHEGMDHSKMGHGKHA